jgi:hypothetical protein
MKKKSKLQRAIAAMSLEMKGFDRDMPDDLYAAFKRAASSKQAASKFCKAVAQGTEARMVYRVHVELNRQEYDHVGTA